MVLHRSPICSRSRPLPQFASCSASVGRVKPAEVLQPITSAPRMVRRCIESASTGNWRAKSPRPEQPSQPSTAAQVGSVLSANGSASEPGLFAVETAPTIRLTQHRRRAGETCRGASANHLGAAQGAARRYVEWVSTGKWWPKLIRPEAALSAKHSAESGSGLDREWGQRQPRPAALNRFQATAASNSADTPRRSCRNPECPPLPSRSAAPVSCARLRRTRPRWHRTVHGHGSLRRAGESGAARTG